MMHNHSFLKSGLFLLRTRTTSAAAASPRPAVAAAAAAQRWLSSSSNKESAAASTTTTATTATSKSKPPLPPPPPVVVVPSMAGTGRGTQSDSQAQLLFSFSKDRTPVSWTSLFLVGVAAASAVGYYRIERERRLEAAMGKIVSSESTGWTPKPDLLARRQFVQTPAGQWVPVEDGWGARELLFACY